jgi:hypothetical protein
LFIKNDKIRRFKEGGEKEMKVLKTALMVIMVIALYGNWGNSAPKQEKQSTTQLQEIQNQVKQLKKDMNEIYQRLNEIYKNQENPPVIPSHKFWKISLSTSYSESWDSLPGVAEITIDGKTHEIPLTAIQRIEKIIHTLELEYNSKKDASVAGFISLGEIKEGIQEGEHFFTRKGKGLGDWGVALYLSSKSGLSFGVGYQDAPKQKDPFKLPLGTSSPLVFATLSKSYLIENRVNFIWNVGGSFGVQSKNKTNSLYGGFGVTVPISSKVTLTYSSSFTKNRPPHKPAEIMSKYQAVSNGIGITISTSSKSSISLDSSWGSKEGTEYIGTITYSVKL